MTGRRKPPTPPHPLGKTRAERLRAWESRAVFGRADDPITEVARRVVLATSAPTEEDMARLALQAIGLDGARKTDANLQRLRDALETFGRAYDLAVPDDNGASDLDALEAIRSIGTDVWLYLQVMPAKATSYETARRLVDRLTRADAESARLVKWARRVAPNVSE